eukprot:scaffold13153_cov72-Phaeocystis_antarctica.AAC.3
MPAGDACSSGSAMKLSTIVNTLFATPKTETDVAESMPVIRKAKYDMAVPKTHDSTTKPLTVGESKRTAARRVCSPDMKPAQAIGKSARAFV